MSDEGKVIDVAAGLVFRDNKLLIARRPPRAHLGGLWEFPGGKRESGETFEHCLARELIEELGIEIDVHELVEAILHEYPGRRVHLQFFRCRWRCHEPQPILCDAIAWITEDQLPRYEFPAADLRVLEKLRKNWRVWSKFES
jgi:8-oxo-dGTP diphosphatase